jgi:hypothetical protein
LILSNSDRFRYPPVPENNSFFLKFIVFYVFSERYSVPKIQEVEAEVEAEYRKLAPPIWPDIPKFADLVRQPPSGIFGDEKNHDFKCQCADSAHRSILAFLFKTSIPSFFSCKILYCIFILFFKKLPVYILLKNLLKCRFLNFLKANILDDFLYILVLKRKF